MNRQKLLLVLALLCAVVAFFAFDLGRFLTLDYIKQTQGQFAALYEARPALVIGAFLAVYVAVTALSFPGAAILTLLGGAVFGLVLGTVIVSFASSIGGHAGDAVCPATCCATA